MKRNILLTVVDGFHYRYLVQTGILNRLQAASDKLVLCGMAPILDQMRGRADSHLVLSEVPPIKVGRKQSAHLFIRSCASRRLTETLNIKSEQLRAQSPWRWWSRRWLSLLVESLGVDPSLWFESAWFDASVDQLLREHEISLLVLSTPGQKLEDLPYLEAARRQRIPTISPVYSWDNLTAKGPFVIPPDQLVVWNDVMKQEACHFHGYRPENVFVGGVPIFDPYVSVINEADDVRRQKFLTDLGLDPAKRLITLTTIPPVYYGSCHRRLLELIKQWIAGGDLPHVSVLIRPHPMDNTNYDDLVDADIVVDAYGSQPNVDPRLWRPAEDNTWHLGRTMAFSDVVINIASTITVDAACFDTPIVNVAFDLKSNGEDYFGSVSRYYQYTHYRQVADTGAAAVVRSPAELLSALRAYIADPTKDREARATLVRTQVGLLDGRASEITAEAILSAQPTH